MRPEAPCLLEGNRVGGVFFFFNIFRFAFLRNGVGSWKSLEGFHSNYPQQLGSVFWWRMVPFFFFSFFKKKKICHYMPKRAPLPATRRAPEVQKHGRNSSQGPYLASANALSGSDCS